MTFGEKLKELRIEKGLTQKEFGKIFNMQRSRLSQYETNKRQVDDKTKTLFADYFNISLDYLLGRSNIRNPELLNIDSDIQKLLSNTKSIEMLKDFNTLPDIKKQEVLKFVKFQKNN